MISSNLFVYGTLMRGYVHPMARLLSANADFLGEATCRGRLYMVKHYPGLTLSDDAHDIVHGELYRLREVDAMLREFDMYEACGEGFPEPTQYLRKMLHGDARRRRRARCVDLHLQLAGREARAHRVGAVFAEIGCRRIGTLLPPPRAGEGWGGGVPLRCLGKRRSGEALCVTKTLFSSQALPPP